jgi:hypothetical protein
VFEVRSVTQACPGEGFRLKKCPNMTWSDLVEFDYTDYTILCIVFLVLLKQVTTFSETASGRLSTAGKM